MKRRGAYLIRGYSSNRDVTPNFLQSFDVDDGRAPCPMRTQTVTAPQALFLMNSPAVKAYAKDLAERLKSDSAETDQRLELLWFYLLNRPITVEEKRDASEFISASGEGAWEELCHGLIASSEFLMEL